ncbi:MAG TPA: DinB family protein, partial [Ferruginibacter sp.]|nr:DinB family protein [Ferruginibacter sp.]
MEDLRYPIGRYTAQPFSEKLREEWLIDIQFLPQHLENAVQNLDAAQLDTAYREGGWTVKQVVHHVADSHMNSLIRFKLGLTEDNPTIKPYDE